MRPTSPRAVRSKRRPSLASDGFVLTRAEEAFEHVRPTLGRRLLLASDFDGTLSRLVMDPWRAGIIPAAQRALRRLAGAPHTRVALISGRTATDLASRVRVGGATYLGDHGAERAVAVRGFRPASLNVRREPVEAEIAAMAERLKAEVPRLVDEPWLVLEDKGPSLTFHFRSAPDIDGARTRIRAAVEAIDRDGLLDQPGGRRAWELRPPGATTKGVALARLISEHRPDAVLMLGDDHNDALAFDSVRDARARGAVVGLAIAVVSPAAETADIAPRADLILAEPGETARLLGLLARERSA